MLFIIISISYPSLIYLSIYLLSIYLSNSKENFKALHPVFSSAFQDAQLQCVKGIVKIESNVNILPLQFALTSP
jgi:hypothetical protein